MGVLGEKKFTAKFAVKFAVKFGKVSKLRCQTLEPGFDSAWRYGKKRTRPVSRS
jgi:hypothetical protein